MSQLERLKAAVAKAIEMRACQREYFKTRDRDVLGKSKKLEKEADKLLADAVRPDDLLDGGQ